MKNCKLILGTNAEPLEPLRGLGGTMLAAIRIQVVLAILVVLNLIGLTIAAYRIMKRK